VLPDDLAGNVQIIIITIIIIIIGGETSNKDVILVKTTWKAM
jgi:hypothetical protein